MGRISARGACGQVTFRGKRGFADVINDFEMG